MFALYAYIRFKLTKLNSLLKWFNGKPKSKYLKYNIPFRPTIAMFKLLLSIFCSHNDVLYYCSFAKQINTILIVIAAVYMDCRAIHFAANWRTLKNCVSVILPTFCSCAHMTRYSLIIFIICPCMRPWWFGKIDRINANSTDVRPFRSIPKTLYLLCFKQSKFLFEFKNLIC